jgi:hypothetical protein
MKSRYMDNPEKIASSHPFIAAIFDNPTLDWKDVIMLGMETFLGGIDAVSEVKFTKIFTEQIFITALCRRTNEK